MWVLSTHSQILGKHIRSWKLSIIVFVNDHQIE
jgi:hypothetical protein